MKYVYLLLFVLAAGESRSQQLYFPPLTGTGWETLAPGSLGWCDEKIDSLYQYLEEKNSKAFIVLKDGRIVLEKYFGTFVQDSIWYWASAGKSATAMLVGIAQQEGLLDIEDPVSDHLGQGWTSAPPDKEALITIRHQLTMTSGLDDGAGSLDCTLPSCLHYLADAGSRWSYHNAPYTLLDQVVEAATGQNYNVYFNQKIKSKTGMKGLWVQVGYNNVYFSDARSMARYGLLVQNGGYWGSTPVLSDAAYFGDMLNTSQDLNLTYGYLWWLNGKDSFMAPGSQLVFNGPLSPNAPADMVAALGKNGQFLNISLSEGLVFVRMGDSPEGGLFVPWLLNDEIWKRLNDLACTPTGLQRVDFSQLVRIFPNPAGDFLTVEMPGEAVDFSVEIFDLLGRRVFEGENSRVIDISGLRSGAYVCFIQNGNNRVARRFVKN